VRLVAPTNRDLEKMMEKREFRRDLYYRLNVFPIGIPPLRERVEDIFLLARYFTQKYGRRMQQRIESIPAVAMRKLLNWYWPGNIRELENFIERSVILTNSTVLQAPITDLGHNGKCAPVADTSEAHERDEIVRILKLTSGRVGGPAGAAVPHGPQTNDADLTHEEAGHRKAQSVVILEQVANRAALPTEPVHEPGTMTYSEPIRGKNERLFLCRRHACAEDP